MSAPQRHMAIDVVIAAYDARDSIATAIASALDQPEVSEVVVVDDASRDGTAEAARAADDGTGRLRVVALDRNGGPARARNRALDLLGAPFVAVLDADDRLLPNRFANLPDPDAPDGSDWDFFADNIAFLPSPEHALPRTDGIPASVRPLSFEEFVAGNISRRGAPRGELGFMKPVMRRAFLERHGLRYDETLRLGEDYAFYANAFLAGGRFRTGSAAGYAAIMRPGSLSGTHSTADLGALVAADEAMLARPGLGNDERTLIRRHRDHVKAKHELRRFLDEKRTGGLGQAFRRAATRPTTWPSIALGIAADKLAGRSVPPLVAHTLFPLEMPGASR